MQCFPRIFQERARVRTRARGPGRAAAARELSSRRSVAPPGGRSAAGSSPLCKDAAGHHLCLEPMVVQEYLQRYLLKRERKKKKNLFLLCYPLFHSKAAREMIISYYFPLFPLGDTRARSARADFEVGLLLCLLTCLLSPPRDLPCDALRAGR